MATHSRPGWAGRRSGRERGCRRRRNRRLALAAEGRLATGTGSLACGAVTTSLPVAAGEGAAGLAHPAQMSAISASEAADLALHLSHGILALGRSDRSNAAPDEMIVAHRAAGCNLSRPPGPPGGRAHQFGAIQPC